MKKSFFGLLAVAFISLSSFTTKESKKIKYKHCTYLMYGVSGYLGTHTIMVDEGMSCGNSAAVSAAIYSYNYFL